MDTEKIDSLASAGSKRPAKKLTRISTQRPNSNTVRHLLRELLGVGLHSATHLASCVGAFKHVFGMESMKDSHSPLKTSQGVSRSCLVWTKLNLPESETSIRTRWGTEKQPIRHMEVHRRFLRLVYGCCFSCSISQTAEGWLCISVVLFYADWNCPQSPFSRHLQQELLSLRIAGRFAHDLATASVIVQCPRNGPDSNRMCLHPFSLQTTV